MIDLDIEIRVTITVTEAMHVEHDMGDGTRRDDADLAGLVAFAYLGEVFNDAWVAMPTKVEHIEDRTYLVTF